ncbi:MAG: hypothetical protein JO057_01345, partial [Chloroflexi bacterium]|nr:hypothetical protein [Chloroflexota bacterium]
MAAPAPPGVGSRRPPMRLDFGVLARAMAYARGHRRLAVLAYGSLLIATFAQLVVPQLVNVIVDTVVGGIQADSAARTVAPALVAAMIAIVVFALVRAIF